MAYLQDYGMYLLIHVLAAKEGQSNNKITTETMGRNYLGIPSIRSDLHSRTTPQLWIVFRGLNEEKRHRYIESALYWHVPQTTVEYHYTDIT